MAALAVLAIVAGTTTVMAASNSIPNQIWGKGKIGGLHGKNLTDAQKTEIIAKTDAIKTALTNNDYTAWVTAEKALNANSPLLSKINSTNFSQYVEAYKLIGQASTIMTSLGINKGGTGMMGRGGDGLGLGFGSMMANKWGITNK